MQSGLTAVPTASEMNDMLARSTEEMLLFERMDAEMLWPQSAAGAAPHHVLRSACP